MPASPVTVVVVVLAAIAVFPALLSVRIVPHYQEGALFRLGRVIGVRKPGLQTIISIVDVAFPASLMSPIQELGALLGRESWSAAGASKQP
jgi:regulator of protease activity HflC (stomatin/prohibitin superfamily)